MLDLARGLKEHGEWDPWVLLPKEDGPLVEKLKENQIRYEVLKIPSLFLTVSRSAPLFGILKTYFSIPALQLYVFDLVRVLKKNRTQVIHSNGLKCHIFSVLAGFLTGIPVIWHLRDLLDTGPTQWTLKRLSQLFGPTLIANSQTTAEAFRKNLTLKRKQKLKVIYNGFDLKDFSAEKNHWLQNTFKLDPSYRAVGILGALAKWKGQKEFIQAAARLNDLEDVVFFVMGDEIYDTSSEKGFKKELEDEVLRLDMKERVLFTGFVSNPVEALRSLDVLVHASTRPEPFGRVIAEAMACEVPVVAPSSGGPSELIQSGKTGLLFAPHSIESMANAIRETLENPQEAQRRAKEARNFFEKNLSLAQHVKEIMDVYEERTSS